MDAFIIASQYLISRRRIDLSELPLRSGLARLLVAVAVIGISVVALQVAATGYSAGPVQDTPIVDARLMQ